MIYMSFVCFILSTPSYALFLVCYIRLFSINFVVCYALVEFGLLIVFRVCEREFYWEDLQDWKTQC